MARGVCLLVMLSGCGALLFVDDDDERPKPKPAADAAPVDAGDASAAPADDGGGDAAIDDGRIDCLGGRREAFFCDGFESTPAGTAPQPPWASVLAPPNSTNDAQLLVVDTRSAAGARSLRASVGGGLLGGNRRAQVRWKRPDEPGPLALQFKLNIPTLILGSWDDDDEVVVAALRPPGTGVAAVVSFIATGNFAGRLVLKPEGSVAEVDLGVTTLDRWQCIELVADQRGVTAYVGASSKGTVPVPMAAESAELGLATNVKSKEVFFDDVIIAPSRLGCTP